MNNSIKYGRNLQDDSQYQIFAKSRFYPLVNELLKMVNTFENEGISFFFFQTPVAERIKSLSDKQKKRVSEWTFDFNHISDLDLKRIKEIYSNDVNIDYLRQVYDGARVYSLDGVKYLADFTSRYVNIVNGKRVTVDQPEDYNRNIYVFGQCTARGTGVEDKDTIPSVIQSCINEANLRVRVENDAVGCGSDLYDDMKHMQATEYISGDIVVLCSNLEIVPEWYFEKCGMSKYCFDTSKLFERADNYDEWFTDSTFHTNRVGNKIIGEYIYKELYTNGSFLQKDIKKETESRFLFSGGGQERDNDDYGEELGNYISEIIEKYRCKTLYNGAIVMNCNPFTLGHQYLIDYARKEVEHLYIFVVQEDRSYFRFSDRYNMVRLGTEGYNNVSVVPSGKFIISADTFPGYFYKDNDNSIDVDTSKDLTIFGKFIAPALNIKIRFAGSEPYDRVTWQYNQEMKRTLTRYGIEFREIERKNQNEEPISASKVRKMLKSKEWDDIAKIVPVTTLDYLKNMEM